MKIFRNRFTIMQDSLKEKKDMSTSKFIAGFVVGGAIGAIAGILLAPKSGEETRKILADTAQDMAKRADETAKQIQTKADDAVSDLQKKGEEIKEKLQDFISKQKESTEEKHD
jgi:gas vesicle protein